jgi:dTDP-4-amino-4,6-dideoxygalactose transaminase
MCNSIIGGEFQIDPSSLFDKEKLNTLNKNEYLYSTGRGAILEILNSIKKDNSDINTVLLPDYLCDSISNTVLDSKMNVEFFHVNSNLRPDKNDLFKRLDSNKALFVINYFGLICLDELILEIKSKMNIPIIYDKVQDLFSIRNSNSADFTFTSFRKWLAVVDGALVITDREIKSANNGEKDFLLYKLAGALLKEYSADINIDDSSYLSLYEKGEELLDKDYLGQCSLFSKQILETIDFDLIKNKRFENYSFLKEKLGNKISCIENTCNSVSMFFPILVENRDEIRKALFKNNIFCPIHWPKPDIVNNEQDLYERELSLIIDQRYDIDDMKRIVEVIDSCLLK